jgi:CBS domain containing-hemolysin-like protein
MVLFLFTVFIVMAVSATCSLTEAALYSVRTPYVRQLAESGSRSGRVLQSFKENMERPIAAILILNTIANTAGAAIAGAEANFLFGPRVLVAFSVAFTLAILFFSEIIPKTLGVAYNRPVAVRLARPVNAMIFLLSPLLWLVGAVSKRITPRGPVIAFPEDEVRHMAMLSAEEGSILRFEAELVKNALALDQVTAKDIMTPRTVVQKLSSDMTVRDVAGGIQEWTFSRIPIYDQEDPEKWVGVVLSRDVLTALAHDRFDQRIGTLARPLDFVPERTRGHVLLRDFLKNRRHLSAVVDEYGSIVGIVTLEDILESVLGEEIMDEMDITADLQELAKRKRRQPAARRKR